MAAIKRHFFATPDLLNSFIKSHPEAEFIFDKTNINYIAVGDVLDIVDFLEESEQDTIKLKFLFLIRSFYSIRLYQAYDLISENKEEKVNKNDKLEKNASVESSTRLSNMNLSEYDKLVAGYFINTRLSRIIPAGRTEKDTRDERRINFEALMSLIDKVVRGKGKDTDRLCLVEFFLLGISRRFDTQNDTKSMQYRTAFPVFYAESLEHISKNAYFDVGALLYNLTRIENCYKRFKDGNEIYKYAQENKNSLLNKFRIYAIKEKAEENISLELKNFKQAYWNSCSCFRNAEIIKTFRAWAERTESSSRDHMVVMSNAFNRMGNFCIPTYDKYDGNYYKVTFGYMKELGALLKKGNIKEDFMRIFDNDYTPKPEKIDIKKIIGRVYKTNNRVSTRIKHLKTHYPIIFENYKGVIDSITKEYGKSVTKEELEQLVNKIDSELEKYRN